MASPMAALKIAAKTERLELPERVLAAIRHAVEASGKALGKANEAVSVSGVDETRQKARRKYAVLQKRLARYSIADPEHEKIRREMEEIEIEHGQVMFGGAEVVWGYADKPKWEVAAQAATEAECLWQDAQALAIESVKHEQVANALGNTAWKWNRAAEDARRLTGGGNQALRAFQDAYREGANLVSSLRVAIAGESKEARELLAIPGIGAILAAIKENPPQTDPQAIASGYGFKVVPSLYPETPLYATTAAEASRYAREMAPYSPAEVIQFGGDILSNGKLEPCANHPKTGLKLLGVGRGRNGVCLIFVCPSDGKFYKE